MTKVRVAGIGMIAFGKPGQSGDRDVKAWQEHGDGR